MELLGRTNFVVAAIGLGDSRFRYGYVYKTSIMEIATSFRGSHVPNDLGPSVVLLTSDKKVHSLGRDAQTFYRSLSDEEKSSYCYFKYMNAMEEHDAEIITIEDTEGRQHNLQEVLRAVFVYFRKLIKEYVRIRHNLCVGRWVVYIPADWSLPVRKVVTTAAIDAEIILMSLRVVMDTEAAVAMCRYGDHRPTIPGSKIMLVQIGESKTSINVLEYTTDNTFAEIYRDSVANLGEVTIFETLTALMKSLVGAEIWEQFERDFPVEHRAFIESFIEQSRTFSREISKDTRIILLDTTLQTYVTEKTGRSIETLIDEKYTEDEVPVEFSYESETKGIIFNLNMMEIIFMFVPVIKELINETLQKFEAEVITKLCLVGEFAQSRYVREALEIELSHRIELFYPLDCEQAILKGSLITGKETDPCRIVQREELELYTRISCVHNCKYN